MNPILPMFYFIMALMLGFACIGMAIGYIAREGEAQPVFICRDPAYDSDSGIQPDDLPGYQGMCEWRRAVVLAGSAQ